MNLKSFFTKKNEASRTTAKPSPSKKILVVDDNPVVLKAIEKILADDYQIFTATDGAEAVTAVRQHNPDLILLDLNFLPDPMSGPFSDGFDVFRWIRQQLNISTIPVIIVSDMDPEKYKDRFEEGEISGYFRKPLNKKEIIAAIEKSLARSN